MELRPHASNWLPKLTLFGLGLVVLAGCESPGDPVGPPAPSFEIFDGAHNGGNEHFFFLPPMVSHSQTNGTFDRGLSPIIRITDGNGFDITLNAGLDSSNSHYHQNWHTRDYTLDPDATYRITVEVDGTELGHADVMVASNGSGLKNIDTNEYIALKDGRTLPIMFRIEEGALVDDPPPPNF